MGTRASLPASTVRHMRTGVSENEIYISFFPPAIFKNKKVQISRGVKNMVVVVRRISLCPFRREKKKVREELAKWLAEAKPPGAVLREVDERFVDLDRKIDLHVLVQKEPKWKAMSNRLYRPELGGVYSTRTARGRAYARFKCRLFYIERDRLMEKARTKARRRRVKAKPTVPPELPKDWPKRLYGIEDEHGSMLSF